MFIQIIVQNSKTYLGVSNVQETEKENIRAFLGKTAHVA